MGEKKKKHGSNVKCMIGMDNFLLNYLMSYNKI